VLQQTKRESVRERDLPAHVVIYYVIALALYMQSSYREVLRCLMEGLHWLADPSLAPRVAGKSGISQARTRLGAAPLRKLYDTVARPVAGEKTRGAWYRRWRLMSLDGSTLDVADTKENAETYGRPSNQRGDCAYPKIRFVTLLECGTHVLCSARMSGYQTSETALAAEVVPALGRGVLCLADRLFSNHRLWSAAKQNGADLLWRVPLKFHFAPTEVLPDGSFLSVLRPSDKDRRAGSRPVVVRVIDYHLKGAENVEPLYRLITTILDAECAPASELAALYHQRWEIETALDELKTHARLAYRAAQQDARTGGARVLRPPAVTLRDPQPDARSSLASRRRPGSDLVPTLGARCPTQHLSRRRYSPLSINAERRHWFAGHSRRYSRSESSPAETVPTLGL
jgi:hypothetical protein